MFFVSVIPISVWRALLSPAPRYLSGYTNRNNSNINHRASSAQPCFTFYTNSWRGSQVASGQKPFVYTTEAGLFRLEIVALATDCAYGKTTAALVMEIGCRTSKVAGNCRAYACWNKVFFFFSRKKAKTLSISRHWLVKHNPVSIII